MITESEFFKSYDSVANFIIGTFGQMVAIFIYSILCENETRKNRYKNILKIKNKLKVFTEDTKEINVLYITL